MVKRKSIRLVVVGDELVGKSSLINTIYSELPSQVQKTLKKVILPPEMCPYSKEIFTQLIDTSSEMDLTPEIKQVDLVLLVYDVSDPETISRIGTDWLPRICAVSPKIPIILVGNKMDKKELQYENENDSEYTKVKDVLKKVTKRYKNVQMGIECSAFYDRNVKTVLNCAQRAVLYPLSPLYDLENHSLTPEFKKALIRIFRILDSDLDGKLYDSEMNTLQERVFQSELNIEDIKAIKDTIIEELESDHQDYIELQGFFALQKKCIEMLKIQICWSILRHFNYNDNLRLQINQENFTSEELLGDTIQLTNEALEFLIKLYSLIKRSHSKMQMKEDDDLQAEGIISKIFESSPSINLPQFMKGQEISEEKFVLGWSLHAFVDYKKCYEDLLYLGYERSMDETFLKKKCKRSYKDFEKLKQNKVISVVIVQSPEFRAYLDTLFTDGSIIETEKGLKYKQSSALFSKNIAKTYLLFLVNQEDLTSFFNDPDCEFAKKIDILVHFQQQEGHNQEDIRALIPENMLLKKISRIQAEEKLKAHQPPQLDFESIPVRYRQGSYNPFFQIIQQAIKNIEMSLNPEKIEKLKKQKKKEKQIIIYSVAGVSALVLFGGGLLLKMKGIKLWS